MFFKKRIKVKSNPVFNPVIVSFDGREKIYNHDLELDNIDFVIKFSQVAFYEYLRLNNWRVRLGIVKTKYFYKREYLEMLNVVEEAHFQVNNKWVSLKDSFKKDVLRWLMFLEEKGYYDGPYNLFASRHKLNSAFNATQS